MPGFGRAAQTGLDVQTVSRGGYQRSGRGRGIGRKVVAHRTGTEAAGAHGPRTPAVGGLAGSRPRAGFPRGATAGGERR
jgi:hypothetical protein